MLIINNTSTKTIGSKNNIFIHKNGSKRYLYYFRSDNAFQQCCRRVDLCAGNSTLFVSYFSFGEIEARDIDFDYSLI